MVEGLRTQEPRTGTQPGGELLLISGRGQKTTDQGEDWNEVSK